MQLERNTMAKGAAMKRRGSGAPPLLFHDRPAKIAEAIETLRSHFMGSLMKGKTGWAWEYRSPRDPALPFAVVVFVANAVDVPGFRSWAAGINDRLFTVTIETGEHFNGCSISLTPKMVP